MNTRTATTTVAATLALSLGLVTVQAEAAVSQSRTKLHLVETGAVSHASGTVIHLGTIRVTAPKAAPTKVDFSKRRGSTAFLGTVQVTADDSPDGLLAARYAKSKGAAFLGVVEVTRDDSLDARYAQSLAVAPGTAYLGSIQVTLANAQSPVLASILRLEHLLTGKNGYAVLGTLAFGRAGG